MSFIGELRRRNVVRVAIAYTMVSWLLLQVVTTVAPILELPDWVAKLFLVMLVLGFIPASIIAWAYELTPEGLKKEDELDQSRPVDARTARRLDRTIILTLLLALAWFAWDKFFERPEPGLTDAVPAALQAELQSLEGNSISPPSPESRSIAVLPFVNMSDEPGNEYFADGLSEELLDRLVKIPQLRVVARTSSFSFKGKDATISDIARELRVSNILEGSVRKSGHRVRITVQLIEVENGFHLWSQTYDRTLEDIFIVQDEIAAAVAEALRVTLVDETPAARQVDPRAYEYYSQGRYLRDQRGEGLKAAVVAFQRALDIDPEYAEALSMLALTYASMANASMMTVEEARPLAKAAIDKALIYGSDLGMVWMNFSFLEKDLEWSWETSQAAAAKALELSPNSVEVQIGAGSLASSLGQFDISIEFYKRAREVDPLNLGALAALSQQYLRVNRFDDAIAVMSRLLELKPDFHLGHATIGYAHLYKGEPELALAEFEKNPEQPLRDLGIIFCLSALGREQEAQTRLAEWVPEHGASRSAWLAGFYAWRGENDLAFELLEKAYVQHDQGMTFLLGSQPLRSLRTDRRWPELLRRVGLLEFWQAMPAEYGGPLP